ncbi:SusC/RagA family TonB-linked outer membrane protein [Mucilaginibacter sp. Bleaf8]|uniref:SusC/RagA family TonB-linked outer membrane protein n=1 Tax=Mucilaginibacter sp. Bleaf8 TaxID=2834430 RepID=UPI001BCC978B|nr:SusC/RagA family TonB-linked outer membrane protein [Mucilaginibacter sp. Bleaf8]MBS7563200.1 SusC/RagA family TonB-linked outer membrane protein [Mucilaginibacter sp. Bleaf8]
MKFLLFKKYVPFVAVSTVLILSSVKVNAQQSPDTIPKQPQKDTVPTATVSPPPPTAVAPKPDTSKADGVQGIVKDEKGQPVPGANIRISGTRSGVTSGADGRFTIRLPKANSILQVSYLGYVTQTVRPGSSKSITVTLAPSSRSLNEVVVTGYSAQQKKDLTGAVAQIRSSDIDNMPVGGVDQLLQGKAAGVSVTQATGAPGEGIAVRVRGVGTINNNNPLYVIDGVPTPSGINQIAPSDIESINILKDASSASIYGARASNGVVVVTTKKGRSGPARFSINQYTGVQTHGDLIKMANTQQYVTAFNTAAAADGREQIPASLASTLPDVNWQKEVLKPAIINNTSLSVNGGSESSNYIVSANYFKQDGLIKNSAFDRLNLRTGVNSTLSKIFTVGTNINLSYSKTRQVGSSGDGFGAGNQGASVMRYALFRTPATPVFKSNGDYVDLPENPAFFGDGLNPVGYADNFDRNYNAYGVIGNVYAEANILKGLKFRSTFGGNLVITDFKQFFKIWGSDRAINSPGSLARSNANQFDYNWTNTLTYNFNINKDNVFTILAGSEAIKSRTNGLSASRSIFPNQDPNFQYLDNGIGVQQNGENESRWALFSLFGRVDYQYAEKYLASFTVRRDGSSRLAPNSRYGNFYAGSVGWRLDRENFLKDVKWLSLLKLRASIGQTGNQEISNYAYTTLNSFVGFYPFGGTPVIGNSLTARGNSNIKWETSTQTNFGLDASFLNNDLQFSADYFIRDNSDILFANPLPPSAGGGASPYINAGKVRNKGLELQVSYRKALSQNWRFDVSGNLATLSNKVLSLAGSPIVGGRIDNEYYATLTTVGRPIGAFYLLPMEGVFQNQLDIFTHAYQGEGIKPGDVKYTDSNGDGVINENDRVIAGSPIPKLTYGFTGNVAFKQFDLSLFFQGAKGNKIYNQIRTDNEGFYRAFNITERVATGSWNGDGSTNEFPRLTWESASSTNNRRPSTRFLEDGSYLRLKNVQLGYNFSSNLLSKLKMSSMRIYVSAQNLFTITKYTGLDPEIYTSSNAQGDGVRAVGIDWGTYPSARIYTLGVNVNF